MLFLSVAGLRTIQSELESAKKWADMLEYAPEIVLSSIEKKLASEVAIQNTHNLVSFLQWTENCVTHFEAAKKGLLSNKKLGPQKKQSFHSKFESIRSQVNFRLGLLEKDYPFLCSHLKSKFNFEVFSTPLPAEKTDSTQANSEKTSGEKSSDSQQSKLL